MIIKTFDPLLDIMPTNEYSTSGSIIPAFEICTNFTSIPNGTLHVKNGQLTTQTNMFSEDAITYPDNIALNEARDNAMDALDHYFTVRGLIT